jgi:hypothetical protein
MFYWEKKSMKKLLILLSLVACSTMTEGTYKKKFHVEDFKSTESSQKIFEILKAKMEQCYPQSDYPTFEKTISQFDAPTGVGSVKYQVDNQSMGAKTLVLVEIMKLDNGSLIKLYSKGDLLRSPSVFKHQVQKWLDGKKVDCDSRGEI